MSYTNCLKFIALSRFDKLLVDLPHASETSHLRENSTTTEMERDFAQVCKRIGHVSDLKMILDLTSAGFIVYELRIQTSSQ